MYKWLAVFDNAEFVVCAVNIHDAKNRVEIEARKRGIRKSAQFELYRLGGVSAYGKICAENV